MNFITQAPSPRMSHLLQRALNSTDNLQGICYFVTPLELAVLTLLLFAVTMYFIDGCIQSIHNYE